MMTTLKFIAGAALCAAVMAGCSETQNEKPLVEAAVSVHGAGFADISSTNHHAKYLRSKNDDLSLCRSCHGADYKGGTTGQSCVSCHNKTGGPENCTTCHGSVNAAPPKDLSGNLSPLSRGVGMHQSHLNPTMGANVACSECHAVPATVAAVGHIDTTPGAEIRFDSTSVFHRTAAAYDRNTGTCANTYCHGNHAGGNSRTMTWTDTSSAAAACGTCHGDASKATVKEKAFPLTGHTFVANTADCSSCHRDVLNADMTFKDRTLHINGKTN